jgi:hypothetical protein
MLEREERVCGEWVRASGATTIRSATEAEAGTQAEAEGAGNSACAVIGVGRYSRPDTAGGRRTVVLAEDDAVAPRLGKKMCSEMGWSAADGLAEGLLGGVTGQLALEARGEGARAGGAEED